MTDKHTISLEYRKFTVFLADYLRAFSRGWLFVKMKQRYPIGATLTFRFTIPGVGRPLDISGAVIYQGRNDEGKEGTGVRLSLAGSEGTEFRRAVEERCRALFGDYLAEQILAVGGGDHAGA